MLNKIFHNPVGTTDDVMHAKMIHVKMEEEARKVVSIVSGNMEKYPRSELQMQIG